MPDGFEVERKFLTDGPGFSLDGFDKAEITQGYIAYDPVIRVRKQDGAYRLTVKGHGHLSRREFEMELTETQYAGLWPKTACGSIEKTRYFIPIGDGLVAEYDVYHARLSGFMTVEVEFQSVDAASSFAPPAWFGREVTDDGRYNNASLSRYGVPR